MLAVVAALVFVGGRFAWNIYSASRPVSLPVTLDGMSIAGSTRTQTIGETLRASLASDNPNVAVQVRLYSDAGYAHIITVAQTVGPRTLPDLGAFGTNHVLGPVHAVGASRCASSSKDRGTVCLRVTDNRAVVVSFVSRDTMPVESHVAELVDQVWGS